MLAIKAFNRGHGPLLHIGKINLTALPLPLKKIFSYRRPPIRRR